MKEQGWMQGGKKLRSLTLLIAAFLLWGIVRTPWVEGYVKEVRMKGTSYQAAGSRLQAAEDLEAVPVFAPQTDDSSDTTGTETWQDPLQQGELLDRIRKEAAARRIAPVDARIDPVWKAIPGYNGREVDVDKTFRLTSTLPAGSPIHFVYKEISPKVQLEDLGAQPIYRGNPKKPMVSLMINVAWGDEYLPSMLETLRKENVHATFFFDGMWLSKHVDTAKEIAAAGHEVSNHAYSHPEMSKLGEDRARQEISKTETLLKEKLGVNNRLFAPPSGDFSAATVKLAQSMNLYTVLWTVDTVDWRKPTPDTVLKRVAPKLGPGVMVLMHPTASSSQALEGIIQAAKKKGLVLGTVSELISPNRVPELETRLDK